MAARALQRLMGLAARRPGPVALAVFGLALVGGALALATLRPSSAPSTYTSSSSPTAKASAAWRDRFGDDAIYVLADEPVTKLVLTSDLGQMLRLEGCLGGHVPRGAQPVGAADGPCARLARTKPARAVVGPGTFVNTSANQINDELVRRGAALRRQQDEAATAARELARARHFSAAATARAESSARQLVQSQYLAQLLRTSQQYGLTRSPSIDDPQFVSRLVFDAAKPAGTPKARFAYLFPSRSASLIQVRLRADLSEAQRRRAIADIRDAAAMGEFRLRQGGGSLVVTGAPVLVSDLSDSISSSLVALLIAALVVMALTLVLVFRVAARLLPLAVAVAAVGIAFGASALLSGTLTLASIGVLPVLIGLGVDYAIQVQSRLQEQAARGGSFESAVARVAAGPARTVVTAAAATAAGFLVLLGSPVPMVRGFGALLVGGIFVALACALTLGTAALSAAARRRSARQPPTRIPGGPALGAAVRGAGELVFETAPARALARAGGRARDAVLRTGVRRPRRVLAVALLLALAGWGLDTQTRVISDVQQLVPQDLSSVRELDTLQHRTGVFGEVDVLVRADDVTDPAVIGWMSSVQARLQRRAGYSDDRGCGRAELCPAFSLPALFGAGAAKLTRPQVDDLLDQIPPSFAAQVVTPDRRAATLAFGVRLESLARQQRLYDAIRAELRPPPGVRAELVGLPVLAAQANADVSSPWRRVLQLLLGLLAVGAVLLVALRSVRRAVVPLVPIALATGWSALVLFALQIPLNPMSVTLGALVVAITTEFSVVLAERCRAERTRGASLAAALEAAYRSVGAAVLASGITAIMGFAVLVLSDVRMLRDFGLVTVVDLAVSLLGVLAVLPAVLALAERRGDRPSPRAHPDAPAPAGRPAPPLARVG